LSFNLLLYPYFYLESVLAVELNNSKADLQSNHHRKRKRNDAVITGVSKNLEIKCSVCLELLSTKQTYITQCGHEFHQDCYDTTLQYSNSCPICRTTIGNTIFNKDDEEDDDKDEDDEDEDYEDDEDDDDEDDYIIPVVIKKRKVSKLSFFLDISMYHRYYHFSHQYDDVTIAIKTEAIIPRPKQGGRPTKVSIISDGLFQIVKQNYNRESIYKIKGLVKAEISRMNINDLQLQSNHFSNVLESLHLVNGNDMTRTSIEMCNYHDIVSKHDESKICEEHNNLTKQIKALNDKRCIVEKIKDERFGRNAFIWLIRSVILDLMTELINLERNKFT
jgi:hypothetical protein